MRIFSASLGIITALFLCGQQALAAGSDGFHPAKSGAEQALDNILEFDKYIDKNSQPMPSKWLTPRLQQALAKAEADEVKKNCNGTYIKGKLCGLGFNPITCAQDVSNEAYLYRTAKITPNQVIIEYSWQDGTAKIAGTYRMTPPGKDWRLDAIDCGNGVKFNW